MTLQEKLDKALGITQSGQSTKGPGQASTGPELGAPKGNQTNHKKSKRSKAGQKKFHGNQ